MCQGVYMIANWWALGWLSVFRACNVARLRTKSVASLTRIDGWSADYYRVHGGRLYGGLFYVVLAALISRVFLYS